MISIAFTVAGFCKPAGSKRGIPIYRGPKDARVFTGGVSVVDANKNSADWKRDVKVAAQAAYSGPLLTCALLAEFTFWLKRLSNHWSAKGGLKPSAPPYHKTKQPGDLLKLARGVEDALSGVIYVDDSQIKYEVLDKEYQKTPDGFIGVVVAIKELPELERPTVSAPAARVIEPNLFPQLI